MTEYIVLTRTGFKKEVQALAEAHPIPEVFV